jgi:hypothetical protein
MLFGWITNQPEDGMNRFTIVTTVALCTTLHAAFPTVSSAQGPSRARAGASAVSLKQDMRKLWTDHVVWTRDYIIAAVADQPDAKAAATRLMKNQEDIGNAVATFYGAPAGQQLTTLLKEHITIAVELIKAAKAGDKAGQQQADSRWQQNAMQIADFLSTANPNTLADPMKQHLSTTTNEVVARLNKDWEADVRAFDEVYEHILHMADALSDGIVKQFANKFA